MGTVSALRAVLALQDALDGIGLPHRPRMDGDATRGWETPGDPGPRGFSVKPDADGGLVWHLVASPGDRLRWIETETEDDEGEIDVLREPVDPMSLEPLVRAAFADLDIVPTAVRLEGHGGTWDDTVSFEIDTAHPDWLEDPRTINRVPVPASPRLVACHLANLVSGAGRVPLYLMPDGSRLLTREAVEAVCRSASGPGGSHPLHRTTSIRGEDGTWRLERSGRSGSFVHEAVPSIVENHWGDRVECWSAPSPRWLVRELKFRIDVPALVAGKYVTEVPFAVIDAQFGDDAPWSEEKSPVPRF